MHPCPRGAYSHVRMRHRVSGRGGWSNKQSSSTPCPARVLESAAQTAGSCAHSGWLQGTAASSSNFPFAFQILMNVPVRAAMPAIVRASRGHGGAGAAAQEGFYKGLISPGNSSYTGLQRARSATGRGATHQQVAPSFRRPRSVLYLAGEEGSGLIRLQRGA